MSALFICSFAEGLDEIPQAKARDHVHVLRVLDRLPRKRFSVFEATANQRIATSMTRLVQEGYIATDNTCGYPWTKYTITEKGRAALDRAGNTATPQRREKP